MHPLVRRILSRGLPIATMFGLTGFMMGYMMQFAVKAYGAELTGNQSPALMGPFVLFATTLAVVAILEWRRWRLEQYATAPKKVYDVPPPAPGQ